MKEKILKILSLCLELKNKDIDVWLDWAPHVNKIGVRNYALGLDMSVYLDEHYDGCDTLDEMIEKLESMK